MADWRKQLIKQAEACCNIDWGLMKMHNPEELMVWLDAFEQGLMFRKLKYGPRDAVELAPVRSWPVKLPRGVSLQGLLDRWVLVDNKRMYFALMHLASVQATIGEKIDKPTLRGFSAEDAVEGELAYRKARTLADRMVSTYRIFDVKPNIYVWMVAGGNGIQTFGTKSLAAHDDDPRPIWRYYRQRDREKRRIVVHLVLGGSALGATVASFYPSRDRMMAVLKKQRGWPAPQLNELGHYMSPTQIARLPVGQRARATDLIRGFEYEWSLDHPRFNPWTRRQRG